MRTFFDNLLPDSEAIRLRIASRYRTESAEAFDLLQAIGRDCVGAGQLLGEDEEPRDGQRILDTPLTDAQVERLLIQNTCIGPCPVWRTSRNCAFRLPAPTTRQISAPRWKTNGYA